MTICSHSDLSQLLLSAVQSARFSDIYDYQREAQIEYFPTIDLAVILFPPHHDPVCANVLFSRDFPQGYSVVLDPITYQTTGIRWRKDTGCYWQKKDPTWTFTEADDLLPGSEGINFISPYPASVFKVIVAAKILQQVEAGRLSLDQALTYAHPTQSDPPLVKPLRQWLDSMLCWSDNVAAFLFLKQLHDLGEIQSREWDPHRPCYERTCRLELKNTLNTWMQDLGLTTLQVNQTRPCDGSFFTSSGSGVGQIHMTAWDTVRLLWLIDPAAPVVPWIPNQSLFLSPFSKQLLWDLLAQQGLHEILSTAALCGMPGVEPGIPALLPQRWLSVGGQQVIVKTDTQERRYSLDARLCQGEADVIFAHKTGLSENYGSAAGIVKGIRERGASRHYCIAFFSNLGYRYTTTQQPGDPPFASGEARGIWYPQTIPRMAAYLDQGIQKWVGK
jgi:hypothetical protein